MRISYDFNWNCSHLTLFEGGVSQRMSLFAVLRAIVYGEGARALFERVRFPGPGVL